jgi:hypothetical protein
MESILEIKHHTRLLQQSLEEKKIPISRYQAVQPPLPG